MVIEAIRPYIDALPLQSGLLLNPLPVIFASIAAASLAIYFRLPSFTPSSSLPCINPKGAFEFTDSRVKKIWFKDGTRLLGEWFAKYPDKPVRVNTDLGLITILPSAMAQEIRNDDRLDRSQITQERFHVHLPGFEPFTFTRESDFVPSIIRKDLTQKLSKVTDDLVEETSFSLKEILTDSTEWHEVGLRPTILQLVARISSRVFLGEELCRNPDWLRVTKDYTVVCFNAAIELSQWSRLLRPIVNRFNSSCLTAQAMVKEARAIIAPVIAKRMAARAAASAAGETYAGSNDAMDWFASAAGKRQDDLAAIFQLSLSLGAIHTTTDLLSETLLRIAQNPQVIPALRNEVISVYRTDGWCKTGLYKMRLHDSVLKETQRMKPIASTFMFRTVTESFVLSDGTPLQKGQRVGVTSASMLDASNYENPDTWDPYRFVRLRDDPVRHNMAHLVSTSSQHLAFGHGHSACPGRFFAANEMKVALAVLVIKYDIMLAKDAKPPQVLVRGTSLDSDPLARLHFRRRHAEIDLD